MSFKLEEAALAARHAAHCETNRARNRERKLWEFLDHICKLTLIDLGGFDQIYVEAPASEPCGVRIVIKTDDDLRNRQRVAEHIARSLLSFPPQKHPSLDHYGITWGGTQIWIQ